MKRYRDMGTILCIERTFDLFSWWTKRKMSSCVFALLCLLHPKGFLIVLRNFQLTRNKMELLRVIFFYLISRIYRQFRLYWIEEWYNIPYFSWNVVSYSGGKFINGVRNYTYVIYKDFELNFFFMSLLSFVPRDIR